MTGEHRLLVVEDDQPTAEQFGHILRAEGYEVTIVDNAKDAFREVIQGKYCLVVSDLDIKEDSDSIQGHAAHGSRLIESIRRIFPGKASVSPCLPIIIVSGRVPEADPAVQLMKAGANTRTLTSTSARRHHRRSGRGALAIDPHAPPTV